MKSKTYKPVNYSYMKAIWLSQFDLSPIYKKDGVQRSEEEYLPLIKRVLQNVKNDGYNTVIVQIRPNGDSMYPSKIYPASAYSTGSYGRDHSYDQFGIIVREAHGLGLSVHAWINPLRCMLEDELRLVSADYTLANWLAAKECYGRQIVNLDGRIYLDPSHEDVRRLIIEGAGEALDTYDLDGLHMDDYFYPTTDPAFDEYEYAEYLKAGGRKELADYRREALDLLVSGLYKAAKKRDAGILFGISPAGNIGTVYNKHYADVYKWSHDDGYIDYLTPQVYFGLEHETFDFKKVCGVWQKIVTNPKCAFTVGMTFGKAKSRKDPIAGSGRDEWELHRDVMRRCLEHTLTLSDCRGIAVFCYSYFRDPLTDARIPETIEEAGGFTALFKGLPDSI